MFYSLVCDIFIRNWQISSFQTFYVRLVNVTGGAALGTRQEVRVGILKNDSPNGLFRFVTSQAVVRESKSSTDPDGEVRLSVERIQGSEGVVNVQWRLNAEAVYDFYEPHTGTLQFAQVCCVLFWLSTSFTFFNILVSLSSEAFLPSWILYQYFEGVRAKKV